MQPVAEGHSFRFDPLAIEASLPGAPLRVPMVMLTRRMLSQAITGRESTRLPGTAEEFLWWRLKGGGRNAPEFGGEPSMKVTSRAHFKGMILSCGMFGLSASAETVLCIRLTSGLSYCTAHDDEVFRDALGCRHEPCVASPLIHHDTFCSNPVAAGASRSRLGGVGNRP